MRRGVLRAGVAVLLLASAALLPGCGKWLGTDWEDNEYEHTHKDRSDR